jgi:hypothetical protein
MQSKPVTLIAKDGDERTRVSSIDLFRVRRFAIERVQSLSDIHPATTNDEITCPSCGKTIKNLKPSYMLPPCPNGCELHPSRWVVVKKGVVDRAIAYMVVRDKAFGLQIIKCYVDSWNLSLNDNYAKLQVASSNATQISIDAIPLLEYDGAGKHSFVLWITIVHAKSIAAAENKAREIEFKVDVVPIGEKETVHAIFFSNIDFMRYCLDFYHYHLQTGFPDLVIKCNDGTKKVIEFEYDSKNFDTHGHPAKMTDYIICWIHNRKEDEIKVVELSKLSGKKITIS